MTTQTENEKLACTTFVGKKPLLAVCAMIVILGGVAFANYALNRYALVDAYSPVYWRVVLVVYFIGVVACFTFRKRLFPPDAPSVTVAGSLTLPAPFAIIALGLFLFGNATLSQAATKPYTYYVVGKLPEETTLHITDGTKAGDMLFAVSEADYGRTNVGNIVELDIGAGFFGQRWIKGYKILN